VKTPPGSTTRPVERALDIALLAFAFALPLSIAATEIALGCALLLWLATRPWTRPQAPFVRALGFATLGLVFAWLLASATSASPLASLLNARKIYSIAIVFLLADRLRDPVLCRRFVSTVFAAGLVTCGLGFIQFGIRHARGEWDQPLQGVFSTAMTTGNVLTTLALVALAFVLFGTGPLRRRWLDRAALATFLATLLLTFRRGSYLAWLAGSLVLVGLKRARWLVIVPLVVAVALVVAPRAGRERALSIAHPVDITSLGRLSLWKSGLAAYGDRPWTGWGLQDARGLILHYRRADALFPAGHFHNNLVQIAATTGTVGLLAYLAWMLLAGLAAWRAFRNTRSAAAAAGLAAWIGFQVHGMFDWSFGDAEVVNQLFVWLGLALAAGAAAGTARGVALTPSRASVTLGSGAHPPAPTSPGEVP
jgi:O-antigen ligase